MEITLEKIELVKDRTGVTYKEAKEALEAADGNVVDAIISIEDTIDEQTQAKKLGKQSEALIDKMKEIVKRGNVSRIIIRKNGTDILNVPLNAGVLGAVIAPWGMIAAALAALGTKCEIELVKNDGSSVDLSGKAGSLAQGAKEKGTKIYDELKEKAPGIYESVKGAGEAVISKAKSAAGKDDDLLSEEDFDSEWYGAEGTEETEPAEPAEEEAADAAAAVEEAAAAADEAETPADTAEAAEASAETPETDETAEAPETETEE